MIKFIENSLIQKHQYAFLFFGISNSLFCFLLSRIVSKDNVYFYIFISNLNLVFTLIVSFVNIEMHSYIVSLVVGLMLGVSDACNNVLINLITPDRLSK